MNKKKLGNDPLYGFLHTEVEGVDALVKLALDICWSWNHSTDEIWEQLDPALWEMTHNPWIILQTVSREQLELKLKDLQFRQKVDKILHDNEDAKKSTTWFQKNHSNSPLSCVAYFSMEYMLTQGLPIYSGGLGNVAGDQLKAANDMGVPIVAVGLLYQQGYFRQVIGQDGNQMEFYPYNDPSQLPITPLRKPNGGYVCRFLFLDIPSGYVHGRCRLGMLDFTCWIVMMLQIFRLIEALLANYMVAVKNYVYSRK
jgi:starch phosphorylase